VHQSEFSTGWGIDDLRVARAARLLDGAIQRIVGHGDGVDGDGVVVGVPGVGVAVVVLHVAVGVVGRRKAGDAGHLGGGGGIGRLEGVSGAASGNGFGDVAEGIVGKVLLPGGSAAIDAGDAGHVVVGIVAGLRVGGVELIGDGELAESAVGIPGEIAGE